MKKKILISISGVNRSINFEWFIENAIFQKYDITFLIINPTGNYFINYLIENNISFTAIKEKSKLKLFTKVYNKIRDISPDIIHSHYRDSNNIVIPIALILKIKSIYTRHNSIYNHVNHPNAVYIDKCINFLTTKIISISGATDYALKKEKCNFNKVIKIEHGFDIENIIEEANNTKDSICEKYNLKNKYCIGVIARYVDWKGHKYIIKAFQKIRDVIPNAYLVLANCNGPSKNEITTLLNSHLSPENYLEIPYEANIFGLYKNLSIYIHTPTDKHIEAFGQTYIESLILKVPSIFTLSGIANSFIKNRYNALVVDYKNDEQIKNAILELYNNPELGNNLTINGYNSVQKFNFNSFISKIDCLYDEI